MSNSLRSAAFGLALIASAGISCASASSFQTIYSFTGGTDGSFPYGQLVADQSGILYGVTVLGGAFSHGTVFSLDLVSGTLTTLYSFKNGKDGGSPQAGLALDANGNLYGVAGVGGSTVNCNQGCGTIFKLNIATQKFTVLHTFNGATDGAQPFAALLLSAKTLYGSTAYMGTGGDCGQSGCGTLFKYDLPSKTFTTMRELVLADGADPLGKMVRSSSGLLYGTTSAAGANGVGNVFSIDPVSNAYAVVHSFDYHVDGAHASSDLTIKNDVIYGTTRAGGPTADNDGTIFKLELSTNTLTTLYSFTGNGNGATPTFGVVFGASNRLYGGTDQGAPSGGGVLFRFIPNTLAYKTIHDFTPSDGTAPSGRLLYENSALFGVTSGGNGTVFKMIP